MKYKLLTDTHAGDLTKKVQTHLDDGWELYGPPSQTTQESWGHFKKQGEFTVFSQAVSKGHPVPPNALPPESQ